MMYENREIRYTPTILKIVFYFLLCIYFIYHIFRGEYGIYSYADVNKVLMRENNILNREKREIEKRQNKIERLRSDNIDLDLLEEELKRNVGIVDKNEIILFSDDVKKM